MNDNNYWYNLKEDNGNIYIEKRTKDNTYFNNSFNNQYNNYQPSNEIKTRKSWKKAFMILPILVIVPLIVMYLITFFTIEKADHKYRTFMIYMVGSDLESTGSMGTYDLNDIVGENIDLDHNNVILMVGGSKKWHNFVSEKEIGLYELTKTGFEKKKSYELSDMGDSETLSNFLKYTHNIYPSDKYDLIFWNHGLGAAGLEIDEIYEDYLDIYELKRVFENSPFSKEKLELVIFNNCMASNLHIASVMKKYADYMVASEEVMYVGAMIDRLNFLDDVKTTDDGYTVGLSYVKKSDESIDRINNSGKSTLDSTLAIIDLSKIDKLEKSVDELFDSIDLNDDYKLVSKARRRTQTYGAGNYVFDTVDLYTLSNSLSSVASHTAITNLQNNIEDAILYNSSVNDYSNGISIYFPYYGNLEYISEHLYNFGKIWDNSYITFIEKYVNLVNNAKRANRAGSDGVLTLKNGILQIDDRIELDLTKEEKEAYQNANIYIFDKKEDGTYKLILKSDQVSLEGDTLVFNDSKMLRTSNNNTISAVLENGVYKVYGRINDIDVVLNVTNENGYGTINNVLLDSKDKPNGGYLDYNDEDITFNSLLYKISDDGLEEEWNLNFEKEDINNKNNEIGIVETSTKHYYAIIEMYDVNNDVYYSKLSRL